MDLPEKLIEAILLLTPPTIVAVSGFGGSGKSTFAATLAQRVEASVVGVDSFIIDRKLAHYSRWNILDFSRLEREVLRPFMEGQAVQYGHFDSGINAVGATRTIPTSQRLIVEGVGLFRPNLVHHFSLLIWVDCPLEEAIRRGKRRDREEYHHPQDELWDGIWKDNDEQCYRDYQPKERADFVIHND